MNFFQSPTTTFSYTLPDQISEITAQAADVALGQSAVTLLEGDDF